MNKIFDIQDKRILKSHIGAFWKRNYDGFGIYILVILVDGKEVIFKFYSDYSRDEEYKRLEREF